MKLQFVLILTIVSVVLSLEYRNYNGTGNNINNPTWGSVGELFLRGNGQKRWEPRYSDNSGALINGLRSARHISNALPGSGVAVEDPNPISAMHIFWGQFLDHDITLTPNDDNDRILMEVPADDPTFAEYGCATKNCTMPFARSSFRLVNGVREQFNGITSFIDGSSVYGNDPQVIEALRVPGSCKMKTIDTPRGPMMPKNTGGLPNANDPGVSDPSTLFLAGDVRSNENPALAVLHTVFIREHNRLCDEILQRRPELANDQETLFQEARRWNIAYLQRVTFSEYLTSTLGNVLPAWTGYKENVNPGIDNLFATATFRYGHAEVLEVIPRRDKEDFKPFPKGDLPLRECFFNAKCWEDDGLEPIIRGITQVRQNKVDIFYAEVIRNFLFGTGINNFVAVDLFARNIERGRDHGLISYNQAREFFGLPKKTTFEEVSSNPQVVSALKNAYDSVDDIEAYAGALAEDHPPGAFVGELLVHSLTDQYTRLRDGDRFYYENSAVSGFTPEEIRLIDSTRLADIIVRNTEITRISCNVFFTSDRFDCGPDADRPDTGGGDLNGTFTGLDNRYRLTWQVDPEVETITITMSGLTSGWVGFGIADQALGGMIGADAVIGWVEHDGRVHLGNYDLLSRTVPCDRSIGVGICPNEEGAALLTDISGVEKDGWTNITFTRPLKTAHNFPFSEGAIRIIYAIGPEKFLIFHGSDNMERAIVQFWNQGGAPTDIPVPTTEAPGPAPTPTDGCMPIEGDGEFEHHITGQLANYQMFYTVNREQKTIRIAMAALTSGWVGMGVSAQDPPRMVGSRATVGRLLPGGVQHVAAWNLNQQVETQVVQDDSVTLTGTSVCFEGGMTVVRFTRSTTEWGILVDDANGTEPITPVVIAFGPGAGTANQLVFHGANRIGLHINFASGGADASYNPTRLIHGLAMLLGWLLLNIGAIYARFTKKSPIKAFWFKAHRPLQYTGFTIAMFGFLWIIINKMANREQHFNQEYAHGLLGLSTMSLAIIQVAGAWLRPHPSPTKFIRRFWEWKHHIMGRVSLLLSIVTAFLGVRVLTGDFENIWIGVFIGAVGAWLIVLATFEHARYAVLKQERDASLYYKMD